MVEAVEALERAQEAERREREARELAEVARLEQEMCAKFSCLSSSQTELINQLTRESACKSSFNYLLMDPDITQNLPMKMFKVSDQELWRTFVSSIFYVGKGSRSRPFQHLYEAVRMLKSKSSKKPSDKIKKIHSIWRDGGGKHPRFFHVVQLPLLDLGNRI